MLRPLLALALLAAASSPLLPNETSEPARLAAYSLLLDVARVENTFIAVGQRGHVVISTDLGKSWTQSETPTRALLTGVSFADARNGWAVGHDGVIIATTDGGRTWKRQDRGDDLETIFLDVLFLDAKRGFIVGAYGKFLHTEDGGTTWTPAAVIAEDLHLNRISRGAGETLYIAGETGTLLRSRDGGRNWERVEVPYDGSLYGVLPVEGDRIVAYGLRGTILVSDDGGENWETKTGDVKVLIMGGAVLAGGNAVLAGAGGNFFIGEARGANFTPWKPTELGTSIADLVAIDERTVLTVGEAGAIAVRLP
jgi:photosystem II stability/assembly factor-like uncharacterized protein